MKSTCFNCGLNGFPGNQILGSAIARVGNCDIECLIINRENPPTYPPAWRLMEVHPNNHFFVVRRRFWGLLAPFFGIALSSVGLLLVLGGVLGRLTYGIGVISLAGMMFSVLLYLDGRRKRRQSDGTGIMLEVTDDQLTVHSLTDGRRCVGRNQIEGVLILAGPATAHFSERGKWMFGSAHINNTAAVFGSLWLKLSNGERFFLIADACAGLSVEPVAKRISSLWRCPIDRIGGRGLKY